MDELSKQQANELALHYQETGKDKYFTELYDTCKGLINMMATKYAKNWHLDEDEFKSIANYVIYSVAKVYEPLKGDFTHLLMKSIERAYLKAVRKSKFEPDEIPFYLETEEGEVELPEIAECQSVTMYSEEYEGFNQESFVRRAVISNMVDQLDGEMKETTLLFLEHGNYSSVAEILGNITPQGVKKRIQSLSRYLPYKSYAELVA